MTATAASTSMARSSQVRSIERRAGVSIAEVVMDDMAIGDPVSPDGPVLALLGLVPRQPYSAVSSFQVIGNCGVICLPCLNAMQHQRLLRGGVSSPQLTKLRIVFSFRLAAANG